MIELWIFILVLFKFQQICVHFLNTELTKSGVGLMKSNFKKRMGKVEGVLVT